MNADTAREHLSRPVGDAGTPVDMPVSGRSEPRPVPLPDGFAHVMIVTGLPSEEIRVTCTCLEDDGRRWQRTYDPDHPLDDLIELKRQHCAPLTADLCDSTAGDLRCSLPPGHYSHHHANLGGHSITWPATEAPFGTETDPS